jgi:predicted ATPase/DNA-binding SARP family transcriptional activator
MARLSLSLLGPFRATLDGAPIAHFKANKVRALLAYLAVEAHRYPDGHLRHPVGHPRPHPRQALAGLLWPDKPERAALTNLRTVLANLRTAIGDRDATPPFLLISRETIQFNSASDHWLDVTTFQTLVETTAADQPAHQRLEEAVALYRGDLLEGFFVRDSPQFENWVLILRERLHWQALQALDALAAYHEGRGAFEEAIACARRQVALEPWQEGAHRQWMRALALSGQRGAALVQYDACRQVLAEELGVEPEAETVTLYEQIRAGTLAPPTVAVSRVDIVPAAEKAPVPPSPSPPTQGIPEGERRIVTVVQAAVSGPTALLSRVDAEDWAAFVGQFLRIAGAEVHRLGGEVDRYNPEGLVAFFGAHTAHEDDPERAVLAALAVQAAFRAQHAQCVQLARSAERQTGRDALDAPGLRVGVHTGEAIITVVEGNRGQRERCAVMGDVLSSADRVLALVPPGEVRVSEVTHRLVQPLFEWGPGERRHCPLRHKALLDKGRGIEGLKSPLVGRDTELCTLHRAAARLREGIGGIVTVVGEAGIGKSRLVAEVRQTMDDAGQWTDDRCTRQATHNGGRSADDGQRMTVSDRRPAVGGQPSAVSDPIWVEGRCLSYTTGVAYSLWLDLLRGLLGLDGNAPPETAAEMLRERAHALCAERADEIHPFLARMMSLPLTASAEVRLLGIEGEGLQVLTFRAVETLVECAAQREPLVLACEDLHWADPTSLALLEQLLPLTDRVPLLVICIHRPEKDHGCWRIRDSADRLYGHRHTDLRLGPLSTDESAQLVGNLLHIEDTHPELAEGLPGPLWSRILDSAEGNPFYVEEILRSLIDEGAITYDKFSGRWQAVQEVSELALPNTLRGVLMARIDRLERGARQVLQLASVVGRVFERRVLESIIQREHGLVEDLVALQREQMVRQQAQLPEETYIFEHQLTQEAAYESLLWKKRRVLHRRVAEALEQCFPERVEERPGLLAHHWERAGEAKEAVTYLCRAGDQAAAQYANEEAIGYFGRALELAPDADLETRFALLLARERVYDVLGEREAQDRDLVALERLAEAYADQARQAEAAVRRARYLYAIDEHTEAASVAQAAAGLAQAAQDVRLEAMATLTWAQALGPNEREAKRGHLERALAIARAAGLSQVEADVLIALSWVLGCLTESGRACWEQGLRIYRQIGDRRREGGALSGMGGALVISQGKWAEGEQYLRQALDLSRETGDRKLELGTLHTLGYKLFYQDGDISGRKNQAEQELRISREIRDRHMEGEALFSLGRMCTALSEFATARDHFERALPIYRVRGSRRDEGWGLVYLGLVDHFQGDYAAAQGCYEQALDIGRETGDAHVHARALMHLGLLSHHLGDDGGAEAYVQQTLEVGLSLDMGWSVDLIYVFCVLGHALLGLGRPAEAARSYWQCLARHREWGRRHLIVEPLAGLARVALAQGDLVAALAHVNEILDHIADRPMLYGLFEPLRIYLTCYRVLLANRDPRVSEILNAAYRLIQERAATIEDQDLRRSYLENVPAHREIAALWKKASHP